MDYYEIANENAWRPKFVEEIVNLCGNELELPGFGRLQLAEIMEYLRSKAVLLPFAPGFSSSSRIAFYYTPISKS